MSHITVLLEEAVDALNLKDDSVVVDCTLGAGGHARRIIDSLGDSGVFVGIDADQTAIDALGPLHDSAPDVHLVHANFEDITTALLKLKITSVDAILADLGWRSEQFESGGKGFSFNIDEPLAMTYGDPEAYTFTAVDIVNTWEESSIADVIYGYGGERFSRRIARGIVEARKEGEITSSTQLADIVAYALPAAAKRGKTNPATKTFQALRIAVNDELGVLQKLLSDGFNLLAPEGRMAIITFHSLEDRIVKQFFREQSRDQTGVLLTKKPLVATREEILENPRARSAKMRIIQKT